jgi:hypothetical protein
MNMTISTEQLKQRFETAAKQVVQEKKLKREKTVKGAHLLKTLLEKVNATSLKADEKSGFYKVVGDKKKTIYIAKNGGRVDFSFEFTHAAIIQITPEEAKARHIGRIRGQLNFELADDVVLAAFDALLAEVQPAVVVADVVAKVAVVEAPQVAAAEVVVPTKS